MDKLKSIFRPGGDHDDHTLYGTPEHSGQQSGTPAHLTTDPGAEKKEGGIMRQIFNPNGDKYDEERFGTTAHADKPLSDATTGTPSHALQGTEASSRPPNLTQISSASIKSGYTGPYAGRTDGRAADERFDSNISGATGQQGLPDRTLEGNSSGQHHLGRDAAIGGAAAAGTGAAGYEAGKYSSDPSRSTGSDLRDSTTGTHQTERAFPLTGGSTTHSGANPTSTSRIADPYSTSGASQQPSTATSSQPGYGRDAALAGGAGAGALGAGALAHEANKSRGDSNTLGSTSTSGNTSQTYADPVTAARSAQGGQGGTNLSGTSTDPYNSSGSTQQPSSMGGNSHLGRDAGIVGAGALGAGALGHEARRHEHGDNNTASGITGTTGSATSTDPYSSSGSTQQPTSTGGNSHLGRDAGMVGAGALGAGALGHEARHHEHGDNATSATTGTSGSHHNHGPHHRENEAPVEGYVHHTRGPHALDIANRLDPHVPGEFPDASGQDRHHHGRDAGLAGAGLGAAGLGAAGLEHESNRHGQSTGLGGSSDRDYQPSSTTGMTQSMPGASQMGQSSSNDHHLGRDAGIAGGLGAAGLGAHELRKEHESGASQPTTGGLSGLGSSAGAPTSGAYGNPGVGGQDPSLADTSRSQPEHHYGRDAAVAGGVGAAGLGAHELRNEHASGANQPSTGSSSGVGAPSTGAYGSSSVGGQDPSIGQTSRSQPEHHYGRDAAVAGGVGAAGLGAHELGREHASGASQPATGSASGLGGSSGAPVTSAFDYDGTNRDPSMAHASHSQPEHHHGRDAALAGGAGAAGLGAYEATKDRGHTGAQPQTEQLRDNVPKQEKEHHGLFHRGDKETKREEKQEKEHHGLFHHGNKEQAKEAKREEKEAKREEKEAKREAKEEEKQHHHGRDAALAGGAGAAGVGAYEASKHHGNTGVGSSSAYPHDSNMSNAVDPRESSHGSSNNNPYQSNMPNQMPERFEPTSSGNEHHHGRDAALAGGAGAAGLGAYEANKEFGHGSSADPMTQQNVGSTGHHEPNKLHKRNDPRGHPELLQEDPNYTGPGRNASVNTMDDTPRSGSVADPNTHERRRHEYLQDQRNLEASGSLLNKHEKDRHEGLEHERKLESEGLINKHEHDRHEHLQDLREDEARKAAAQPEGEQKKKSLLDKIMYVGSAEGH